CRAPRPGRDIDMGRPQAAKGLLQASGVEQVPRNVARARRQGFRVARQPVDLSSGVEQFLTGAAAGDACRANDKRDNVHHILPIPAARARERRRSVLLRSIRMANEPQDILTITFISAPLGLSSERKPLSTTASGSIRAVMIFSTGSLPLAIIPMRRG